MTRLYLFPILLIVVLSGCKYHEPQPYSGIDGICFSGNNSGDISQITQVKKRFVWAGTLDPNAVIDTCWVEIMSVGRVFPADRPFTVEQEVAKGKDYIYDPAGNPVDSLQYIIPYQAIPGVDYVPFDDPSLTNKYVLPANKFKHQIPIVLKKHSDEHKKTLLIRIKGNATTIIAEERLSTCLITIE